MSYLERQAVEGEASAAPGCCASRVVVVGRVPACGGATYHASRQRGRHACVLHYSRQALVRAK